jgi:hypothetical protein
VVLLNLRLYSKQKFERKANGMWLMNHFPHSNWAFSKAL